ncbi:MAG: SGNH/GDSL hydrolase family protein [Oscillospiraceae bacterium]|nr:SGNH/GDSL hydrolase family protein [Oscillospiraceae bacterium]
MKIINSLQALRAELPKKEQLNVGVWGDSVFLGVMLDDIAGRYRVLKENAVTLCSDALNVTIKNFSKFGYSVTKGKQRLMQHLNKGEPCDVAILEYGGNDCDMPWDAIAAQPELDHTPKTTITQFSAQLQDIIDALVSHGTIPLLTTLPPLHHERYLSWICRNGLSRENILQFLGDSHLIYRHHERYSLEISNLAMDNNCRVVDIRSAFLDYGDYQDLLCNDGIHPNEKGQNLIYETFMSFVDKYLPSVKLQLA